MQGMKLGHVPLERAISKLGIASRSRARVFILAGKVQVNGVIQRDPEFPVVPETAKIQIDEHAVSKAATRTFLLHKPRGVITTNSDEKNRPTVFSLIHEGEIHLVAVGRLDWASSGLLLLTNDTRMAAWLTDPLNGVRRTYLVTVRGRVSEEELQVLRAGVQDEGESLQADAVELRKSSAKESHLTVLLREGKNRELRRLFAAIKHEVTRLKRVAFGGLELGDLPLGQYRELSEDDLTQMLTSSSS